MDKSEKFKCFKDAFYATNKDSDIEGSLLDHPLSHGSDATLWRVD
jgi:hypothetical protein